MIDDLKVLISQQQLQQEDSKEHQGDYHLPLQADQLRLVLHGEVLDNDMTLRDYNLHDGDTIHIVLRLAGSGMGGGEGSGIRPFHLTNQRDGLGEWMTVHLKIKAM